MTSHRADLYAILGVAPSATQAEISHAYRELLRQHHPDTRAARDKPTDTVADQALQQILAAYAVLHDPTRRADYDRDVATPPTRGPEPTHPVTAPPRQPATRYAARRQPPIIAGPVRWHRASDPPARLTKPVRESGDRGAR